MQTMVMQMRVEKQRLFLSGNQDVVADSQNYLEAQFRFSRDWDGIAKTAVFRWAHGEQAYHMLLQDDRCFVPCEVIRAPGFKVAVFGGDLITTDAVTVEVKASGMEEGVAPPDPTPDIYAQLVNLVEEKSTQAAAAAEEAENWAKEAENTATVKVYDGEQPSGYTAYKCFLQVTAEGKPQLGYEPI